MSALSRYIRRQQELLQKLDKIKMRAHLNADAMYAAIRRDFGVVPDQRAGNSQIPMVDALMSGFAMFSLKAHPCSLSTSNATRNRSTCIAFSGLKLSPATARCGPF